MENEKEKICSDIRSEISGARQDFEIMDDFSSCAWTEREHQAYIKGLVRALEISEGK